MILNARTERDKGRTRLYAADRFANVCGVWQPIADAVSLTRDAASGAYVVTCGDARIVFTPAERPAGQLVEARVGRRRFGDVLDAKTAPDVAEYRVRCKGRIVQEPFGWRFADVEGAQVGVFLHDWAGRFGADKVRKTADTASVDLRAAKAVEGVERIDLDPTLTAAGDTVVQYQRQGDPAWPDCRNGEGNSTWGQNIEPGVAYFGGFVFSILRVVFSFDTSQAPEKIGSATLHVYKNGVLVADDAAYFLHVPGCSFDHTDEYPPADLSPYAEVLAAYGTAANRLGSVASGSGNGWTALDATDQYANASDWCIGVMAGRDAVPDAPTNAQNTEGPSFADPGTANEPYLELTSAGPPVGTRSMMGMGC